MIKTTDIVSSMITVKKLAQDFICVFFSSDCLVQIEFFASGDNACSLVDGEDGVLFVKKPDGRATGDAFVLLAVEHDAEKALQKHKENMGSR